MSFFLNLGSIFRKNYEIKRSTSKIINRTDTTLLIFILLDFKNYKFFYVVNKLLNIRNNVFIYVFNKKKFFVY